MFTGSQPYLLDNVHLLWTHQHPFIKFDIVKNNLHFFTFHQNFLHWFLNTWRGWNINWNHPSWSFIWKGQNSAVMSFELISSLDKKWTNLAKGITIILIPIFPWLHGSDRICWEFFYSQLSFQLTNHHLLSKQGNTSPEPGKIFTEDCKHRLHGNEQMMSRERW